MRPRAQNWLETMFESLSDKLGGILDRLTRARRAVRSRRRRPAMREVRRALLEADVALEVVRGFVDERQEAARSAPTVIKSVTPGQMVVKIVHDQLIATLGSEAQAIDLECRPARRHHDGRSAGLRQDHDHRQDRPAPVAADAAARC